MRTNSLAALLALVTLSFWGCEGSETATPSKTSSEAGGAGGQASTETPDDIKNGAGGGGGQTSTETPDPFEIEGSWLYLGPWDGPHTLEIASQTVQYVDIADEWSSNWELKEYDNELHRFELVFESGNGSYSPNGQNLSATYVLNNGILTVQLAEGLGAFQQVRSPGSCTTEGSELIPNCKIYMQQQ